MPSLRPTRSSRLSGQPHQTMASTRRPSRHPSPQETVPITFRTAFYGKKQLKLLEKKNKLCDFRSPPSLPHRKRRRSDSHDQDSKPTKPFKHNVCSTPHAALLPSCSVPNASMRIVASIERSGKLGVRPSPTQQRRPHQMVASTQRHSKRPKETIPTVFTTAFCGRKELESMVKRDQVCEWLRGLPCPASH